MFFSEFELRTKFITDPLREFPRLIQLSQKRFITIGYLNAHVLALLLVSRKFRQTFASLDYVYPDGWGGVLYLRLLGLSVEQRSSAPDFFFPLCDCLKENTPLFLLGGNKKAVRRLAEKISVQVPQVQVVGTQGGYFRNDNLVVRKIIQAQPDWILVGMGADQFWQLPKQEQWVIKHLVQRIDRGLMWCVGDLFNQVFTERKSQSWYTEWWERLKKQPKKMIARYIFDAIGFAIVMILVTIQLWKPRSTLEK